MSRKAILIVVVSSMFIAGIIGLCIPFIQSLSPSASAGALLPKIDISGLKDGDYLVQDDPKKGFFTAKYLVIRDYDSKLYVYTVPFRDGQTILPDLSWWRFGAVCDNFGPDMEGSKIKPSGLIQCQDHDRPDIQNSKEWQWSYSGNNQGEYTSDMEVPRYAIEGNYVILGKF